MTDLNAPFAPDWVSPPGDSISDIAEERGWTQAELARRLGYTEKHVSQLINGKVPLTIDAAQRLERALGSTFDFWMAREANYQKHKARQEAEQKYAEWTPWLDKLPLKELMSARAIPKRRIDAKNKPLFVEACLRFFGVASPEGWNCHYLGMEAAFRRTRKEQSDPGAISAWLRLGEKEAEKVGESKYHKSRFEKALRDIRNLTCENPGVFEPKMRRLLQEAGVLLVLVPAIPRAHVSGVARWLGQARPLIQLSLYGKTNDRFWFTFFHEAAHILLHADGAQDKASIFLDDKNPNISDHREDEANRWSGEFLIPSEYDRELRYLKNKAAVKDFAEKIGIHPGIVVGRLQHDELIKLSWMNDLKESFCFKAAPND
ncbi:MAG: helix-turn-helix domain-containing protein [Azoarcus sp.]|jgi:HTH-type transcriptional regulator/antitoxin HigA|nr:helix-turn-helix domain-containing protein [Azoarcus sp.]